MPSFYKKKKKPKNLLSMQKYEVCQINQRRTENFTFIFFV